VLGLSSAFVCDVGSFMGVGTLAFSGTAWQNGDREHLGRLSSGARARAAVPAPGQGAICVGSAA
jgi:hypothetical protein